MALALALTLKTTGLGLDLDLVHAVLEHILASLMPSLRRLHRPRIIGYANKKNSTRLSGRRLYLRGSSNLLSDFVIFVDI